MFKKNFVSNQKQTKISACSESCIYSITDLQWRSTRESGQPGALRGVMAEVPATQEGTREGEA